MVEGIFLAGRCVFAHGGVVVVVGTRYRWWTKKWVQPFLVVRESADVQANKVPRLLAVCCRLSNCEERTLLYASSGAYYLEATVTLETNERQCQGQQWSIEQASILGSVSRCAACHQPSNRRYNTCVQQKYNTYVMAAQRACFIHTSVWRWRF